MFSMANWGLNDPLKEAMAPVSLNPYMAGGNQMVNGIAAPGPAAVAPAFGSSPLTINPDSIFPNGSMATPGSWVQLPLLARVVGCSVACSMVSSAPRRMA